MTRIEHFAFSFFKSCYIGQNFTRKKSAFTSFCLVHPKMTPPLKIQLEENKQIQEFGYLNRANVHTFEKNVECQAISTNSIAQAPICNEL